VDIGLSEDACLGAAILAFDDVGVVQAGANATTEAAGVAAVCWASVKPEYWPPKAGTPVPLGWNAPSILFGVTCLMFGGGTGAAGWIDRLIHSARFAGLTPRPEDLAVSGSVAAGCWSVPVRNMDCKSAPKWDPIPKKPQPIVFAY